MDHMTDRPDLSEDSTASDDDTATPWEFLPGDDEVDSYEDTGLSAEEQALHVESKRARRILGEADRQTVHYQDDEDPETPDRSVRSPRNASPSEVDDLLIRQHYLEPED